MHLWIQGFFFFDFLASAIPPLPRFSNTLACFRIHRLGRKSVLNFRILRQSPSEQRIFLKRLSCLGRSISHAGTLPPPNFIGKKAEIRNQESGVRSQESGVRSQRSVIRNQKLSLSALPRGLFTRLFIPAIHSGHLPRPFTPAIYPGHSSRHSRRRRRKARGDTGSSAAT